MRITSNDRFIKRFNKLDFHDDNLRLVTFLPPRTRHSSATIVLEFEDDATGAKKLLSFHNCGNLRFVMDFDVLANNWFAQTRGAGAIADIPKMKKFVTTQKMHWRTIYMPPQPSDRPIRKKLRRIRSYRLFKIRFFGGTLEILARSFKLK
jgi:hypothetical protein